MNRPSNEHWSRRDFLKTAALAGTGAMLGFPSEPGAAEPPPETGRIRLIRSAMCQAPQYVAEGLLRGEGFTDVQEIKISTAGILPRIHALAAGEGDFLSTYVGPLIARIDAGDAVLVLSGLHAGCFRLYATKGIRSIRDLKGKTIAVDSKGGGGHSFLASMASYVGLNPHKDINWVTNSSTEFARLLADGKIDAYMDFPSAPQEPRPEKIGRMVLNSAEDRPWSQYFCCMVAANREFVKKNPLATKRALRAILKAANICALEPDRTARLLVDKGFTKDYDYILQRLKDIPYGKWRDYDPEDTLRFYGLRLHEAGMIKSNPEKIISQGTDWRFLRELKKELKA